jgi:hypothetical protein
MIHRMGLVMAALGAAWMPFAKAADPNDAPTFGTAPATGFLYGVDTGIGETDNITLVPANKVSQTIATADADFSLVQRTYRFDDNVKGQFSYFDYLQHAYNSQIIGNLNGIAHFAILPERIIWVFQDNYGEAQLNPFAGGTPANLEYINSLLTGPEFTLHFGPATFLKIDARYTRVDYQTSPFDSNRYLGSAELGFLLSARSTISLNVSSERDLYQNTVVNTDVTQSNVYGEYQIEGARTLFTAKLGVSRVDQDGTGTSGSLASVSADRKLSPASTLTLSAVHQLTDASASLSTPQQGAINSVNTSGSAVTSSIYTATYVQAGWQFIHNRNTLRVSGRWEKDTYNSQPMADVLGVDVPLSNVSNDPQVLDNSRRGLEFSAERRMTRALSVQLYGSYYQTDYPYSNFLLSQSSSKLDDSRFGAGLTYRRGRGLQIQVRYDHIERSVTGNESGTGYQSNAVYVTIGYRPRPADYVDPMDATPSDSGATPAGISGTTPAGVSGTTPTAPQDR